tara:strand:+ start:1587 stop:3662 length:2076 start_codon:yes stop_codon:yes gene_type:complete
LGVVISNELEAEQAYVDRAYECLEAAKERVFDLTSMVEVGKGGTNQARVERDAIWDSVSTRLGQLNMGDAALVFGRIDQNTDSEIFYIGRVGVWDDNQDPIVVDWRAPIAESFYRATGSDPMGLERRRHFVSRGRSLLALEDEIFGDIEKFRDGDNSSLKGEGALIAALETARTGRLQDIIGTIQGEQDEIIRAPISGVVAVQGGPGTGKTVVALHRAAYLLYTHRFPLQGQGVLVVGPNRLFLAYIEQVLPSLGEAGVEMAALGDLVGAVRVEDHRDPEEVSRLKGDLRMVKFLTRATKIRQRAIREDLRIGYGVQWLHITVEQTAQIVAEAQRRFRTHNAARRYVEEEFYSTLALNSNEPLDKRTIEERIKGQIAVREALDWMWPVLTPSQLLNDTFGSLALIKAADPKLTDEEANSLYKKREKSSKEVTWSASDAALLDEALAVLGPRPGKREEDAVRTFGHIVVDEIQDLSPMDLRMLSRRSLNGSMTVVGDIAQATGAWAHHNWESILRHLPDRKEAQMRELTIGYRIPAPLMELAANVLSEAAPGLKPPSSVRADGEPPIFLEDSHSFDSLPDAINEELKKDDAGNIAVVAANSQVEEIETLLNKAGIVFGRPNRRGLDEQLAVVPVGLVKGLEVDVVIVVEPKRIIEEQIQGMRALYVALTRATKRVIVVHSQELPANMEMKSG